MKLTFLGTGGGRFTMTKQLRHTGGMHLEHDGFSLHVDPGPGALVYALKHGIALDELDGIMVTHAHLDHCNDVNVLIEAMTAGGDKRTGTMLVNRTVVDGADLDDQYVKGAGTYGNRIDPVLDRFHRGLVEDVTVMEDGMEQVVGPYTLRCLQMQHSDPHTIGFTLGTGDTKVGFTSDTELFEDMFDFYADCDVLVMNVMRPLEHDWKGHLTTEDAATLMNEVEPGFAILQAFGSLFIYESITKQQEWLEEHTDVDFVLAEDGMEIDLAQPKKGLERFL